MKIITKNISKIYNQNSSDEFQALENISIDLETNQIIGVIGPNGSGKSSLGLILAGLMNSSNGELKINEQKIINSKKDFIKLRNKIGYSFQFTDLQILRFTIFDEVALSLKLNKDINFKEKTESLIERVNLSSSKNESPYKLSQGQKRKVNFLSSISTNPELLILDEPTANLDSKSRRQVIDLIKELKTETNLIIVISHDIDLIWELTNKTIILNKGRVVSYDETNIILRNKTLLENNNLELPHIIKFSNEIKHSTNAKTIFELAKELNGK